MLSFVAQVTGAAIKAASEKAERWPVFAFARVVMQEITPRHRRRYVRDGFGDIDPADAGRGAAASAEVASRYAGLIEAVSNNLGLTPHERAKIIASLRQQQATECKAASERAMREAKGKAKARRMMRKNELG